MEAESRHIVGIVGGSCAGKTWLSDSLQKTFPLNAARLSQDDFYLDRSHLPSARRARLNFDHPRSIDWNRLEFVLSKWVTGETVSVPRYDFVTHGRLEAEAALRPAPVILVEGLWLFRRTSLRKLFTLKVFIRSSNKLCVERRLQRDTLERGRTREQVLDQVHRHTLPMFDRFVAPQEKWAEVVLKAPIPTKDVEKLATLLQERISTCPVGI